MGRTRTGSTFWHGNHFDLRITLPDGTRADPVCLSPGVTEEEARAEALRYTRKAAAEGWTKIATPKHSTATGNTFDVYAERWLATRRDPKEADAHLRLHILPVVVGRDLDGRDVKLMDRITTSLSKGDVEIVVAGLDDKIRTRALSWKSASNVWGTLSKLLDDATHAKRIDLRVLAANPAEGVRGPDRGEDRQSAYLFPNEATTFLACDRVPLHWRVAAAIAMYSGLRRGELAVLRVADVVLEGGYINVSKASDRTKFGEVKSTKGKRARRVPIEPNLRPLLERITKERDGAELLVHMPSHDNLAGHFRKWLTRASVARAELHADDAHRRPLNWHDLRHTFATWLAISGASALTIQTRLGHADQLQLQKYVNEAEAVGHGDVGTPFPPLPSAVLGDEKISSGFRQETAQVRETKGDRRGSNPMVPKHNARFPAFLSFSDDISDDISDVRGSTLAVLGQLKTRAVAAHDIALAKRIHTWEGEMLGDVGMGGAKVIDLTERKK